MKKKQSSTKFKNLLGQQVSLKEVEKMAEIEADIVLKNFGLRANENSPKIKN